MKTVTVKLPCCGLEVEVGDLTIDQAELVASDFRQSDMNTPAGEARFETACAAAGIVSVNGAPVDHATFDARSRIRRARDWSFLKAAQRRAIGIPEQQGAMREMRTLDGDRREVRLPSGRMVVIRPLDEEGIESVLRSGNYGATDWLRMMNDLAALAIESVDGTPVNRETFRARVEFPGNADWNLLRMIQQADVAYEDPEVFFRQVAPGRGIGGSSRGSADTGISRSSSCSDVDRPQPSDAG